MTIGAHISGKDSAGSSLLSSLRILSQKHPEDHFILFTEKLFPGLTINCTQVIISPRPKNKLILYYWYTYKLPALLSRYNADAFISDAGMLCPKSSVPQYLYFCNNFSENRRSTYFKKLLHQCLHKASLIFTTEEFISENLAEQYKISADKIKTVYRGLPAGTLPVRHTSPEEIKNKFTGGFDYFIYPVTPASSAYLIILLKAFSQLKKWQKSSMKLVLLLQNIAEENLIADFNNYRYRDEVVIISDAEENIDLIHHAFSMIWFCNYAEINIVFKAMQGMVPVIAEDNKINRSLFSDGVLFSGLSDKTLAEKMQLVYKDEYLRDDILQKVTNLLKKYDADAAAESLGIIIQYA